jgi:hypothetical protein
MTPQSLTGLSELTFILNKTFSGDGISSFWPNDIGFTTSQESH